MRELHTNTLRNLRVLDIWNTKVQSLAVENLICLEELYIRDTLIGVINLADLPLLREVYCGRDQQVFVREDVFKIMN